MKKMMPLVLACTLGFSVLMLPNFLRQGMFVDGLMYATIANNMARGIGSFWSPQLSQTVFPEFHEHPPLVFGIESIFFRAFGDASWIERLYSFLVTILSVVLLYQIWKALLPHSTTWHKWFVLPIFLWITHEDIFRSYPNNMLECTMGLFIFGSLWLLLQSNNTTGIKAYSKMVLAGIFILMGFLCKGFTALYPLSFFMFAWLSGFYGDWRSACWKTLLLCSVVALAGLLVLQLPGAQENLGRYMDQQVFAALQGERRENIQTSRLHILEILIMRLVPGLMLGGLLLGVFRWKNISWRQSETTKAALFCMFLGLAGTVPIVISIKQAAYYMVAAIPFFLLAIGLYIAPGLEQLFALVPRRKWPYQMIITILLLGNMAAFLLALKEMGKTDKRDRKWMAIVQAFGPRLAKHSTIGVEHNYIDLTLWTFFQRYYYVSLDMDNQYGHAYLLAKTSAAKNRPGYTLEGIEGEYALFKKNP
ncbi:MAG: ArnT family glycosyltransferase [Saprospiraceae bacterium]